MHINELPETILGSVFGWHCESICNMTSFEGQFDMWKPRLGLLSVCRLWRELALPIVHRDSFITSIHQVEDCSDRYIDMYDNYESENINQPNSNGDNTRMDLDKSNLDILDITNTKCRPKILQVYVETIDDPTAMLRDIVQKISTRKEILDRVQTVLINFKSYEMSMDNPTIVDNASALGNTFCQLIPSVQHLNIAATNSIFDIPDFFKSLVKGYGYQLKGINAPHWALEKVDSISPELTKLVIREQSTDIHIPRICVSNLNVLKLKQLRNNILWSSFESESSPGVLSFLNLRTLELHVSFEYRVVEGGYNQLYPALEFGHKIVAPKLDNVTIHVCSHTLSILSSIQGISVLKHVEFILGEINVYATGLDLGKAQGLFSRYAKGNNEPYEPFVMVSCVNDMLSIDGLAKHTRALCSPYLYTQEIELIDWKYLNDLEIHYPLKIVDLPSLLSRLPSLETVQLKALKLDLEDGSFAEILDPGVAVEPMESMIRQVLVEINPLWTETCIDNLKHYLDMLLPHSEVII